MRVYILGIRGNMASRYRAILEHLGHEVYGHDVEYADTSAMARCDGFIVATPTHTHIDEILKLLKYNKPIFSEKSLTKNQKKLEEFLIDPFVNEKKHLIYMCNQYDYLVDKESEGETFYNYYKSGNDGLAFDAINVVGLAKGDFKLGNKSPVWLCAINGHYLKLSDMDFSYIAMIKDWLKNPTSNLDYAVEAHKKVWRYLEQNP